MRVFFKVSIYGHNSPRVSPMDMNRMGMSLWSRTLITAIGSTSRTATRRWSLALALDSTQSLSYDKTFDSVFNSAVGGGNSSIIGSNSKKSSSLVESNSFHRIGKMPERGVSTLCIDKVRCKENVGYKCEKARVCVWAQ